MIVPNPENTGTGRRAPNLPQGSSGYVTPGGQTLYPGDGSGNAPWSGASGLTQLLNSLGSSGIGSLFGVNGMGNDDGLGSLGPGSQVSGSEIVDFMNTLFQMPIFNQYGGNFGSANNDPGAAIANFAAALHHVGDPTGGRVPGTSTKSPNIPTPADFAAHARAVGAKLMKQWTDYEVQGHDPNRGSPVRGGPHAHWVEDEDTDKLEEKIRSGIFVGGGMIGATIGGLVFKTPAGVAGGALVGAGLGWLGGTVFDTSYQMTKAYLQQQKDAASIHADPPPPPRPTGSMPEPDGGGGGPRATGYFPSDEGGGGPRSFGEMPEPDGGSGGPKWFPNPDDSGGGPRGTALR